MQPGWGIPGAFETPALGGERRGPLDLGAVEVCPPTSPTPLGTTLGMATEGLIVLAWPSEHELD